MSQESIPKVFIDTDVAFDIISKREPYFNDSIAMLHLVVESRINSHISESTISTLLNLVEAYKVKKADSLIVKFIATHEVVSGGKQIILNALASKFKDKEDAIQYFIALRNDLDYFITRNVRDYNLYATSIPVYTPEEFLKIM